MALTTQADPRSATGHTYTLTDTETKLAHDELLITANHPIK
jgi:hypothetical protein